MYAHISWKSITFIIVMQVLLWLSEQATYVYKVLLNQDTVAFN